MFCGHVSQTIYSVWPYYYLKIRPTKVQKEQLFFVSRFTADERAKRPQLCHIPFGFGPRSCIGMRFALLMTKITLMELLRRYSFVRAPDTEVANGQ